MRPNWSAFHRVREYGPRSVLAAAGVAVGVALTITMSSLVDSVELAATAGLRTIGSDLYYVHPRSMAEFGTTGRPLSLADVTALQRGTSVLEQVSPVVTVQGMYRGCGGKRIVTIHAALPDHRTLMNVHLAFGRFIHEADLRNHSAVAVLGANLIDDGCPRLQERVIISGFPFTVVGGARPQGQRFGFDRDSVIFIPLTTASAKYGRSRVRPSAIEIRAARGTSSVAVHTSIERILRRTHRIRAGAPSDFTIQSHTDILSMASRLASGATALLVMLIGVSAVVAGIGILNSILTAVIERTPEIGLRRAVGATRRDIRAQFLAETGIIVGAGVASGVICGALAATGLALAIGLPATVNVPSVAFAATSSGALGMAAGLWPALRAARINPVDALRHE